MSSLRRALPALLLAPLVACGPTESGPDCSRYTFPLSPPPPSANHISCTSSACGDGLNPPTSGDHCAQPLSCRAYDTEQSRCTWLHNLEHGHVVFLYNCPDGCPDIVSTLDSLRQLAKTGSNGVTRAVLAPDAKLPTRVAALLWRRVWLADDVDADAVSCLLKYQDAEAPEPLLSCLP